MKLTIILPILIGFNLLTAEAQPPDTLWTRAYGGYNTEIGFDAEQTFDGGFIMTGYTHSFGNQYSNVYIVKTNPEGLVSWTRVFGEQSADQGFSIQQTFDGGYIITGRTIIRGSMNIFLLKLDAEGNEIWTRIYGGDGHDEGQCVRQTSDGGYIIAGSTASYGAGYWDVYLIKTDSFGDTVWTRTFGGGDWDGGYSVIQTVDGGYLVAGWNRFNGARFDDVYLVKTDANGDSLWSKTYGWDNTGDKAYSVQQTADGGYIVAGAGYGDVYLLKTDVQGDTLWTRVYQGYGVDDGREVCQTYDGGYIIAGNYDLQTGNASAFVIKTDADGDTLWTRTFPGWYSGAYSVQQTIDGGYVAAGFIQNNFYTDMWLIRFDRQGTPLGMTMIPRNPPVNIAASGGSFSFDVYLENNTSNPLTFDSWSEVHLPAFITYGPIILRADLNLPAGGNIARRITQSVPGNAPAGSYLYIGKVGIYPDSVIAADAFPFTKLAGSEVKAK